MKTYLLNVLDAASHFLNAVFGGMPVESVSGRSYREDKHHRHYINALFFWEENHCKSSHINDVKHADVLKDASRGDDEYDQYS